MTHDDLLIVIPYGSISRQYAMVCCMLEAKYLLSDEFITLNQAETYEPKEATKKTKLGRKIYLTTIHKVTTHLNTNI